MKSTDGKDLNQCRSEIQPMDNPLGISLRKPKGRGGIGCHRAPDFERKGLKKVGDTKRGNEERLFKLLKVLIIQRLHEATGRPLHELRNLEPDHVFGRNASNFEPLGSMLSPLNIQLITHEQHAAKTNPVQGSGISDRHDYRDTVEQEVATTLNRDILSRLPRPWNLKDLKIIFEQMAHDHADGCEVCGGVEDHIDEGEAEPE